MIFLIYLRSSYLDRSLTKIKSKLKEGEIRKFGSLTRAFKQYGDVQVIYP